MRSRLRLASAGGLLMFGMVFLLGAEAIIEIGGIADHATFYTHAPAPVVYHGGLLVPQNFFGILRNIYTRLEALI